jgi:hypothetical protein
MHEVVCEMHEVVCEMHEVMCEMHEVMCEMHEVMCEMRVATIKIPFSSWLHFMTWLSRQFLFLPLITPFNQKSNKSSTHSRPAFTLYLRVKPTRSFKSNRTSEGIKRGRRPLRAMKRENRIEGGPSRAIERGNRTSVKKAKACHHRHQHVSLRVRPCVHTSYHVRQDPDFVRLWHKFHAAVRGRCFHKRRPAVHGGTGTKRGQPATIRFSQTEEHPMH